MGLRGVGALPQCVAHSLSLSLTALLHPLWTAERTDRQLGRAYLTKSRVSLLLCRLQSLGRSFPDAAIKIAMRSMASHVFYLLSCTNFIHFCSPGSQKSEMNLSGLKSGCPLARLFPDLVRYLPAAVLRFLQLRGAGLHHICNLKGSGNDPGPTQISQACLPNSNPSLTLTKSPLL